MAFDLANYEPVAARLSRWLETPTQQQKRVLTYLVHYNNERCVFRAELYLDEVLIATGWAEETRGEGHVNRTSHLENCESSAVGRALANAGLAGSDHTKRPSREEMQKAQRLAPVEEPFPTVVDLNASGTATDKQRNFIKVLLNRKGWDIEQQRAYVAEMFGEQISISKLSPSQASTLIKALQI